MRTDTEVPVPKKSPTPFEGWYRIVEMEVWGPDYFDMLTPAFIEFASDGMGRFQFGGVRGWLDSRTGERDGRPYVEFSWLGHVDRDDGGGRGWAALHESRLEGRLFIHCGDDSGFVAVKGVRPSGRRSHQRRRRS